MTAGVQLLPIDEDVLDRLVDAATSDAAPDEVTPPMAGNHWGAERLEWLRAFHRTADPSVLETGIWLTRRARGHGTGRLAVTVVLQRARELGAREVCADTSPDNAAALHVLQRLGFRTSPAGDRVTAVRTLP